MPSAETFHQVLQGFPGVMLRLGADGRVQASNGRLEARLGRPLVGEPLEELLTAPSRRTLARLLLSPDAPACVLALAGDPLAGVGLSAVWEPGGAGLWVTESAPRRDDDPIPTLQRITSRALRDLDADTLLRRLLAPMGAALGADAITVWLLDSEASVLRRRAKAGVALPAELPLAAPLTQRLLKRSVVGAPPAGLTDGGFAACLSMPLDTGLPLGVVLWGYQEPRGFSERDRQLARLIADYLAAALDRASLYCSENRAQTRAAETLQLREHFVRVIAHDLRNPLTAMLTTVQLLARRSMPGEQQARLLDGAQRAGHSMDRLIRDLVDLATLGSGGRLAVKCRPLDLGGLLAELDERWQPIATQHDIRLRCRVPADLPAALADRERLDQLLGHLLDNALIHTPPGGRVELSAEPAEGGVRIVVADTGPGIEADKLLHLFRPFWQEDPLGHGGAGRGLAIAAAIAAAHAGELRVENGDGAGSRFLLTLRPAGDS